jgi:iron complex outermembrane receptor protein
VAEWEAQIAQSLVQITGVELAPTQTGFNLLLNASSPLPQPQTRVEGNALIAEIDNAVLTETFEQANPTTEIAQVSVVALEGNRVQITITGVEGPPTAEIRGCLRSRKALIGYSLSIDKPTRVISF